MATCYTKFLLSVAALATGATVMVACTTTQAASKDQANTQPAAAADAHESSAMGFAPPAAPIATTTYLVEVPTTLRQVHGAKSESPKTVRAQLLFLDEAQAKKAFANKDDLHKLVAEAMHDTKANLQTAKGRTTLKAELMDHLTEKGYKVDGVVWNEFMF